MRTFAEQPSVNASTLHQGLLYRTATGISSEPRLRVSNAIDYEVISHIVTSHTKRTQRT